MDWDGYFVEWWGLADEGAFREEWGDRDGVDFGELEEGALEFPKSVRGTHRVGDDSPACVLSTEGAVGERGDDFEVDFVKDCGDLSEAAWAAVEFDVEFDVRGLLGFSSVL